MAEITMEGILAVGMNKPSPPPPMEGAIADEAMAEITMKDILADEAFGDMARVLAVGMNNPRPPPPPVLHKSTIAAVGSNNEKSRKKRKRANDNAASRRATGYIPLHIVELVLTRMNPKDAVRVSTACKDWRSTGARYDPTMRKTPWLLTMTLSNSTCRLRSVVDKDVSFEIKVDGFPLRRTYCCGSSQGWLVLECKGSLSLLNPFSRARVDLPAAESAPPILFLYMSSAPTVPGCVLLARDHKHLYVWRPGDESWTVEDLDLRIFYTILSFEGRFYALHYITGKLISFQLFPLRYSELELPSPIDVPHFLVESCGEILLVGIVRDFLAKSFKIYVFRLDLKSKAWIKVDKLGDRALFVNRYQAISVRARKAGCGGNCVYFTDSWSNDAWHVYNMENDSIESFPRIGRRHRKVRDQVWITPCLS